MIQLCAFSDEAAADLEGQIAALRRNNIFLTELRSIDGVNVADFSHRSAKSYREKLQGEGIDVWAIGSPLGKTPISDFSRHLEKVRRVLEIAHIFHTRRVRMFSFFDAYKDKARVIDALSEMIRIAESEDIMLCLENEKEVFGDTHVRVQELLNEVRGLRFVYDPANFIQVGDSPKETLDALHGRADYFHIKDVVAETGELVPAGCGDARIGELLARIEGDKTLTLEPHLAVFEGYAAIDKTALKNKFSYPDNNAAFDAAASALKNLLREAGYRETDGGYVK